MTEAFSVVSANPRITMPYPHIYFDNLTEAAAVVIGVLDKGDLPVLSRHDGRVFKVASIDRSPLNVRKLLMITSITLYRSEHDSTVIVTNEDFLEVGVV